MSFSASTALAEVTVIGVSGDVGIMRGGGGEWAEARVQMKLDAGDSIRTGKGRAVLLYRDGTQARLNNFSRVEIEETEIGRGRSVTLAKGEMWAKAARIGEARSITFTIKTPTAVAAVRGTELDVQVGEDGLSTLTVVEGETEFYNESGGVTVADSQQSTARRGGAPSLPRFVDFSSQIEWIADAYSLGLDVENPIVSQNPAELKSLEETHLAKLSSAPGDPEELLWLGSIYYDMRRYGEALDMLHALEAAATDSYPVNNILGQVYLDTGDTEKARERYAAAAKLEPKKGEPALGLGLTWLKENKLDEAAKAFEEAIALEEMPLAHAALAMVLMKQGKDARPHVEKALELKEDCWQAHIARASAALSNNDFDAALEAAKRAAEIAPNSPMALSLLAEVMFFRGEADDAFPIAVRAAELNPMAAFPQSVLSDIYLQRREVKEALMLALRAAALKPNDPFVYYSVGRAEKEATQYSAALRSFQKASGMAPDFIRASAEYAKLLAGLNRFDEAEAEAWRMIERRPDYAPPYGTLGDVCFAAGNADKAAEYYKKAVELDPKKGQYHSNLALLYIDTHRMKDALEESREAIRLEPTNPWSHANMGYIYDQIDNEDLATHHFRKALELDPDNPLAHLYMGTMMMNRAERYEQYRGGIREFHIATMLDPKALKNTIRRGKTEFTHDRGSFRTRNTRFRHRMQSANTKLNYYVSATQSKGTLQRRNTEYLSESRQFWLGYQHNNEKSYAFNLQDARYYSGAPGAVFGRDDEGDPDDSTLITFTEATLAYRYRPSRKTDLNLRAVSTLPFGSNITIWDYPPNFPADAVGEAETWNYFRDRQERKQVSLEADYTRKWGRKNHELNVGAASFKGKFIGHKVVPDIDFDANPPVFGAKDTFYTLPMNHFVAHAQSTLALSEDTKFTAGYRRDGSIRDGSMKGYKVQLSRQLSPRSWMHVRVKRQIDVFDLVYYYPFEYWSAVDRLKGLEWGSRGKFYELDYERIFHDASFLKLTLFQFDTRNFELYRTWNLNNIARMQGYRVSYQRQLGPGTSFFLDYRYIPKKDRTAGTAYYGRHAADSNVHSGRIYINHLWKNGLGAQFETIHNSDIYFDQKNYFVDDGYFVCNLRMFYDRSLKQRYYLNIFNLFNTDYQFSAGQPQPDRQYMFGMSNFFR